MYFNNRGKLGVPFAGWSHFLLYLFTALSPLCQERLWLSWLSNSLSFSFPLMYSHNHINSSSAGKYRWYLLIKEKLGDSSGRANWYARFIVDSYYIRIFYKYWLSVYGFNMKARKDRDAVTTTFTNALPDTQIQYKTIEVNICWVQRSHGFYLPNKTNSLPSKLSLQEANNKKEKLVNKEILWKGDKPVSHGHCLRSFNLFCTGINYRKRVMHHFL